MQWLTQLFSRSRRYDDLSASIHEHIEERTDELMAEGMLRDDAERTARREFGNVTLMEEHSREVWQWSRLESIGADVRFALRRLRKSPGFAVTVLLTMAIGIGANTAVFTVLNTVLFKPLPYPQSDRLVALWLQAPGAAGLTNFTDGLRLSPSLYFTFAEHSRTLQSVGIWTVDSANVTGLAKPEEVRAGLVSDGVLQTLAVPATAGRLLSQQDQQPHGAQTVMLSYGYWLTRFGGDRAIIGHNITIDSQPREIVGVMPRGFRLVNQDFDVLIPEAFDRNTLKLAGFGFEGVARLRPGASIAEADADITRMLPIWMDSFSNGPGINSHFYETWRITPALRPLKQQVLGNMGNVLWVVMATIGLVMLIACTNVAHGAGGCAAARTGDSGSVGRGPGAHCARAVAGKCVAGSAGRFAWCGRCLCGFAVAGCDRSGQSAPPERDCARWPLARIYASAFAALRPAVWRYTSR
jgi:hypothetical protein